MVKEKRDPSDPINLAAEIKKMEDHKDRHKMFLLAVYFIQLENKLQIREQIANA